MGTLEMTAPTRGCFLEVGHDLEHASDVERVAGPAFASLTDGHPPLIALNCHDLVSVDPAAFAFLHALARRGFEQGTRIVLTEATLDVRRAMVVEGLADSCTLMFEGRASARVLPTRLGGRG